MEITLKKSEVLNDWYNIVRKYHDGREWTEQVASDCFRWMMSERLTPEACIEGTGYEMLQIAEAINNGNNCSFKRVAVKFKKDGVHFYSPKNSKFDGIVSTEEAKSLAKEIFEQVT